MSDQLSPAREYAAPSSSPVKRRNMLRLSAFTAFGAGTSIWSAATAGSAEAAAAPVELATEASSYVPINAQDAALAPVPARVTTTLIQGTQQGHKWTAGTSVGGTTNLNDTTEFLVGAQSVGRSSDGAGGMSRLQVVGGTPISFADKHVSIMLRLEKLANIKWLTIYASSGSLSQVHFKWDLKPPTGVGWCLGDGRWTTLTLNFSDAVKVGTPNIEAITDWQVMAVDDGTGVAVKVNVGKVDSVPRTNRWPNGVWTLSMDDSFASQMPIVRYASQYGIRGTIYNIAELIDREGFLTTGQLRIAQDDLGWEIGGHAMTLAAHESTFTALSPQQLESELSALKMWLRTRGFMAANHIAYPKGIFNGHVLDAVKKHFPGSARGTFSGTTETTPPPERHILRARALGQSMSLDRAKADIDRAYLSKAWIHHYGHQFNVAASSIAWSNSDAKALIDYAVSKGIGIATVGEVLSAQYA